MSFSIVNHNNDPKETHQITGDGATSHSSISHVVTHSSGGIDRYIPPTVPDMNSKSSCPVNHSSNQQHDSSRYSDVVIPANPLATSRYNRQMLIPSISLFGQQRISASRVLVVGLGGLGSPAALYLAGAGVGRLGLLDHDSVEMSNLHRQIVHRESSVRDGLTKVQSATRGCQEVNSEIEIVGYEVRLDVSTREKAEEVMSIVDRYDIVLDCTDNPATRYLISDLCVVLGKVLVSGAAQRLEGQILVLNYEIKDGGRGPCYRCVFPTPPSPEMVKGCGEIGILGPVVGTVGTLMASETLRLITRGVDEARKPTMLLYSAWPTDPRSMFRTIGLRSPRQDCVACGDEETLQAKGIGKIAKQGILAGSMDYVTFCGVIEEVKLLQKEERIDATEFLHTMSSNARTPEVWGAPDQRKWHNALVVDVREPHEIEMGPQFKMGINIPISRILRQHGAFDEMQKLMEDEERDAIVFVCQLGNDSQVAAKKLLDSRQGSGEPGHGTTPTTEEGRTRNDLWIGDVAGGIAAIEKV